MLEHNFGEELSDWQSYKHCRSKRCKRKNLTIYAPERKYCIECGGKLRRGWGTDHDSPVIMDGPDSMDISTRVKTNGGNEMTTDNKLIVVSDAAHQRKEPISWQQFKGDYHSYTAYVEEFKTGAFKNYTANGEKVSIDDTFVCTTPDLEGCPILAKPSTPLVHVPFDMYQKWIWLCKVYKTEWIAYLKGGQNAQTKVWEIEDMYFPRQRATGSHVDAEDGEITEGTIGSVHSHVAMSAFFSEEDKRHFNHNVEMVVNRSGDLAISVRIPLECGRWSRITTTALLIGTDVMAAASDALGNKLTEQQYASPTGNVNRPLNGYQGRSN